MISDARAEKAVEYIRDRAKEYAQAKADRTHLEEFRKSRKALLMKAAELEGATTSAAQERDAYAAPDYLQLLDGLRAAVEREETIRWEMEAARLTIEIWRTQSANNRLEAKAHE
jgi:hypothetical protein